MPDFNSQYSLCRVLSQRLYDLAEQAIKMKRASSAAQFFQRAEVYAMAASWPPSKLTATLLKGLVVHDADAKAASAGFVEAVHAASVPACELNNDGVLRVKVEGELFGIPASIHEKLPGAKRVEMEIGDSLGGSGVEAFKEAFEGRQVLTYTSGLAASAAAYLAQLGCHRQIAANGGLILHPRIGTVHGNSTAMRREAEELDQATERDIGFLRKRTGQHEEIVRAWLSGPDVAFDSHMALEHGLIDEILKPGVAPFGRPAEAAQ